MFRNSDDGTTEGIGDSTIASNMTTITYAIKCICETGPQFVSICPFFAKFLIFFTHSVPRQEIDMHIHIVLNEALKFSMVRYLELRGEIDVASQTILQKYEKSINKTLENFGVEFSIEGVKRKSDRSRMESVTFNLRLRDESFHPNGSDETLYKLANTLSSGDKSTLAFAFFVAKYHNENISNTVLVFDDPITSLDFFRKKQTNNIITRFVKKARQVIVFTHSMEFAKAVCYGKRQIRPSAKGRVCAWRSCFCLQSVQ